MSREEALKIFGSAKDYVSSIKTEAKEELTRITTAEIKLLETFPELEQ